MGAKVRACVSGADTVKADRSNYVLMFACRNCPYRTEAHNPMVYRNDLKAVTKVRPILLATAYTAQEQPGYVDEIMLDPTLRRTHDLNCPNCGNSECVRPENNAC